MIHRVALGRLARLLLVEHLELLGRAGERVGIAAQRDERRVEGGNVAREDLGRVAFGVDGDEQHLHLLRVVGSELLQRVGDRCHRRRTHVGTLGVEERDDRPATALLGHRHPAPVLVGQGEVRRLRPFDSQPAKLRRLG